MTEDTCSNCGEPVVDGRVNCPKCGATYPRLQERPLERDLDRQGDLPAS